MTLVSTFTSLQSCLCSSNIFDVSCISSDLCFAVLAWLHLRQNGVLSRAAEPTRRDTTMTFTTFVMFDMLNALCCRSADKIVPKMALLANKAFLYSVGGSLVGQMLVVYCPPLQLIFQTEALSLYDLVYILFVASSMVALDTARKLLFPDRQQEMSVWYGSKLMSGMTHNMGRGKLSMA